MKSSDKSADVDRLDLLALFEMTSSAHELSEKLGLSRLSKALSDAKDIAGSFTTLEEFMARKEASDIPIKH